MMPIASQLLTLSFVSGLVVFFNKTVLYSLRVYYIIHNKRRLKSLTVLSLVG